MGRMPAGEVEVEVEVRLHLLGRKSRPVGWRAGKVWRETPDAAPALT